MGLVISAITLGLLLVKKIIIIATSSNFQVLTQSKGIVAGIRGDIFSCVFFFLL